MEFRGKMTQVTVDGEDYTHQIFGKDLKIFRKTRNQGWTAAMILQIFNAIRNMPGSFGNLHGMELVALNQQQANNLKKGDLVFQIHHDEKKRPVMMLRKSVCEIEEVEQHDFGTAYRMRKVWPLSVDWSCHTWTQPECIYDPAAIPRPGELPTLYFGFEVVNRDCYEFVGNQRYEQAAAKAREFMAMTECYEVALRPLDRRLEEEFYTPDRERKPEKVEALRLDDDPTCHMHLKGDHNFNGAYYTLRSVLLDKTLQGYSGLFDKRRNLDRITPLMQAMYKATCNIIADESFRTKNAEDHQSTAPIFKFFLNPDASSFSVADRLRALFNPAYCSEADKKDHWALYNRLGLMDLLADNLLKDSPEGKVLQEMFLANYDILHTDVGMPGLKHDSLDYHFTRS